MNPNTKKITKNLESIKNQLSSLRTEYGKKINNISNKLNITIQELSNQNIKYTIDNYNIPKSSENSNPIENYTRNISKISNTPETNPIENYTKTTVSENNLKNMQKKYNLNLIRSNSTPYQTKMNKIASFGDKLNNSMKKGDDVMWYSSSNKKFKYGKIGQETENKKKYTITNAKYENDSSVAGVQSPVAKTTLRKYNKVILTKKI